MAKRKPNEPWRELRVGDKVRFVQLPLFQGVRGCGLQTETRRLYEMLIARGRSQRVYQIDEHRLPWINCRFRLENGQWEYHWLAINDDIWVRVNRRTNSNT